MGLVESIAGKIEDLVIDAVGDLLWDAVSDRPGNLPLGVPVDKGHALGIDDCVLFLAHRPADHICLPEGKACQLTENLDHLLLIDDTAVGDLQDRAQRREHSMKRGMLSIGPGR